MTFKGPPPPTNILGKQAAQQRQINVMNLADNSEMKANKALTKSMTEKLIARLSARK